MRNKGIKLVIACALVLILSVLPVVAQTAFTAADVLSAKTGEQSAQQWIDGELATHPEATEWFVLALSQYGRYDLSAYETALAAYLKEDRVNSMASRQKYALTLRACGSDEEWLSAVADETIGKQGLMTWTFGLHLLNNGFLSAEHTVESVTAQLLSLQHEDGGWSVMGTAGDVDATAMVIQALAPQYDKTETVTVAVDRALTLLSARQNDKGGYATFGVVNSESTAQVAVALSAVGIDAKQDARFIKNGNTVFDDMQQYRLENGEFCHQIGGTPSDTATVQVLSALVAYERFQNGKSPMLVLDAYSPPQTRFPVWKLWATGAVLLAVVAVLIILLCRKKCTAGRTVAVVAVAAVLIGAVWLIKVQTVQEYYDQEIAKDEVIGTVTLTVRCDTITDRTPEHIPDDGYFIKDGVFSIEKGDTVYDVLQEMAITKKLPLDAEKGLSSVYVKGIGGIYEFDHGDLSGWQYRVNGQHTLLNCGDYVLNDGDTVEWVYTLSLGSELK